MKKAQWTVCIVMAVISWTLFAGISFAENNTDKNSEAVSSDAETVTVTKEDAATTSEGAGQSGSSTPSSDGAANNSVATTEDAPDHNVSTTNVEASDANELKRTVDAPAVAEDTVGATAVDGNGNMATTEVQPTDVQMAEEAVMDKNAPMPIAMADGVMGEQSSQSNSNSWGIILSSIAIVLSLISIGLHIRNVRLKK